MLNSSSGLVLLEALQGFFRVDPGMNELERHGPFELAVGPLGQVHDPHASAAQLTHETPGADPVTDAGIAPALELGGQLSQEGAGVPCAPVQARDGLVREA